MIPLQLRRNAGRALAMLAVVAAGCADPPRADLPRAQPPRVSSTAFSLELAGEFILPHGMRAPGPENLTIGGLSGLVFDQETGRLFGVSDAQDRRRAFVFAVSGEGSSFEVTPVATLALEGGAGQTGFADLEAISLTPDGGLFVASEGESQRQPRTPPAVLAYDRHGEFVAALPLPQKFVPTPSGPVTSGTRPNASFESLTSTTDGRALFTASELPLAQDDEPPTFERGGLTRVLEYVQEGDDGWTPSREFVYRLDPAARGDGFEATVFINGLAELLTLEGGDLLALERSFAADAQGARALNRIRLYRVSLDGAEDVSGRASLAAHGEGGTLQKTLVLDLGDVRGLSAVLARLDNFEGMAFGPRLSDGSRSLLMVSDDNFSPRQHTAFLLFRVVSHH